MSQERVTPQVTTPKIGRNPTPGAGSGQLTQIGCSHLPSPFILSVLPSQSRVLALSALQPTSSTARFPSSTPLFAKNFTHPITQKRQSVMFNT